MNLSQININQTVRYLRILLFAGITIGIFSCAKNGPNRPSGSLSDKSITYFGFKVANNSGLPGNIDGIIGQDTIRLVLPNAVPLNNLIPAIIYTGKSINPENNVAQDFRTPVSYTVTAEDGTTINYVVIVTNLTSSSKDITSFVFKTVNNATLSFDVSGSIGGDSISVTLPFGADIDNLIPDIVTTGVNISPATLIAQNFSQPVQYTVTAQDGTTKTYKVIVTGEKIPATIFINTLSSDTLLGFPPTGKVYAIDAYTGNIKWYYAPPSGYFAANLAFSRGVLFTANWNKITAIDTTTKNLKWEFTAGKIIGSALFVENGIVYTNCDDGYLYAIDEVSGNLKWKFGQEIVDTFHGNPSSPTVKDGVVYFGSSMDKYVYAVDAMTGNLKWKTFNTYTFGDAPFYSGASVVDGTIYIGNIYQYLFALNANDGSVKWAFPSGDFGAGSATVVNGVVYIGSQNHNLYAVNAADGTLKWKYYLYASIQTSPIVYQGTVFFGGSGGDNTEAFYALDANDGSVKWTYLFPTDMSSDPIAFNGLVYFSSLRGLYALDVNTGALKWEFNPISNREYLSSPVIVDKLGHVHYSAVSGHKD